ncbi:Long-chain-fatty-acid--CoA ligase [Posidoniimonas polymericola]|uniref:Long-chain-fatty-acid--CoA ligase n=1 Tax=Posidoniimonas polymericola TaxID=2528002 RepID=A0A5C5YTK9_9BACT|nr:acyl-CoA synthetase [Posidoniimonas polymericola]TWT78130.1 Long-chain-fatty-acid--CoA ligase [Posidoniimonas polymericola]
MEVPLSPLLPIIARASTHAGRTAVSCAAQNTTYQQLLDQSEGLALRLLDGRDDLGEARVAFLVPPGAGYVASLWAIWRAGGVAAPLSLSATKHELEYTLTDAGVEAVVVADDLAERVAPLCERLGLRRLSPAAAESAIVGPAATLPTVATDRRAMILYTSGTTSRPKGVITTHACIQAQVESLIQAWRWSADDRIPLFLPLHHIHGIINILSCALWAGAQVEAFAWFIREAVLQRVAGGAYTLFMAVPTIYVKLIDWLENAPADQRDAVLGGFAGMRLMVSGSAALPSSVHAQWAELTGQPLLERYGMTEIGMALSNPYDGERRPGAVGRPLPGVEVRLQDESNVVVAQEGSPGEIHVRGPNVFREYWNRPEATAAAFVDGWFRTGDIAVVEDGYYRIMGRSSVDIIKSGGYKLSALEIEACLLNHPAIAECAVVGVPDDKWGERVAAAVVLVDGAELSLDSLREWSEQRISSYKVPRLLRGVDSLPRNAMGKVKKPAVVKLFG